MKTLWSLLYREASGLTKSGEGANVNLTQAVHLLFTASYFHSWESFTSRITQGTERRDVKDLDIDSVVNQFMVHLLSDCRLHHTLFLESSMSLPRSRGQPFYGSLWLIHLLGQQFKFFKTSRTPECTVSNSSMEKIRETENSAERYPRLWYHLSL